MTANGYIAKENSETPWTVEEWKSFSEKVKEFKNLVIGRKTFEIMKKGNEFQKIANPFTIIVSHKGGDNSHFVSSPQEAIDLLKEKGFSKILVAGGGKLNSSFMKDGLVDEIYLDIEPLFFGKGVKLFAENDFESNLELIETKQLSKNLIQLHYRVVKR